MRRLTKISFAFLLLFVAACSSPKYNLIEHPADPFILSSEDRDFARAVAGYSAGLIAEMEEGFKSSLAADLFAEAARSDASNYLLVRRASTSLLYKGRYKESAGILEEHLRLNPTNYPGLLELAQVYHADRMDNAFIESCKRAIKAAPADPTAYILLARGCFTAGLLNESFKALSEGARHSTPAVMADMALISAVTLIQQESHEDALAWLNFAAKHSPDKRLNILLIIGEVNESLNRDKAALKAYRLVAKEKNATPELFTRIALLENKTDPHKALATLAAAIKQFPENDGLLTFLGYLASQNNRIDMALEIFESTLKAALKDPSEEFYLQLGALYERTGAFNKAEMAFKDGLKLYPDSHIMLNYLAYMWAEKGINLDDAEKMVSRALELEPESGAYLDTLGWVYFMQKRFEEAMVYILKALEKEPDDPVINEHLGDIHAARGETGKAVEAWRKSYSLDSSSDNVKKKLVEHKALINEETELESK